MSNRDLEFRVLSGLQAGARIRLPSGEYTVGTDFDCDIVVHGQGIERKHMTLVVDDQSILLKPEAADCSIEHEHLSGDTELAPGQLFRLGQIWLQIAEPEDHWPDVSELVAAWTTPPAVLPIDEEAAALNLENDDDDEYDDDDEDMADDELDQKPNKLFSRAWVIALSATFVLVLGGVVAVFVNPKLYAIVTRSKATHEEQIACAVREVTKLNMNDRLRITSTASSASTLLPPTVSGYLQSSASLAGLVTALKQQCPQVLVRVYADEELSGLINARLTSQAPNWRIESIRQGRVVLRRTKSEGAAFTLAQNDIKKNVPGLAAVEESQIDAQIKQEVARLLSEASLTTKLNAELREERLDVSGSPSLEEVRRWEEVRAQLQQKFGSQLVLAVKFDRPRNGGLPFDVHQVVAGTMPFVVLTDGTRLFEGGTRDGYTLVSIKGRRLQFVGITQSQPPVELQW